MINHIVDNIEKIINHFGLDLRESTKCYIGPCPIHGGDNQTAFNFYKSGHTTSGNWYCNTHQCEKSFINNAMGFIVALLSVKRLGWCQDGDETISFSDAIVWCEDFFQIKYEPSNIVRDNMTYTINKMFKDDTKLYTLQLTEEQYRASGIKFSNDYFTKRGYSKETINKFSIGYCDNPLKPMYTRAVVPLHSIDGKYIIGCSGRSVFEKCENCTGFHNPNNVCPTKENVQYYSKWKNSYRFPGISELYNFHRAKSTIQNTGLVIITEGQPNVWRLVESGFPMSIASFGAKFSAQQKKILDLSGANTIIVVPDHDIASEKFIENIKNHCKHSYNIVIIEPSYQDDIGKCNIDTVKTLLSPFVEKYREK